MKQHEIYNLFTKYGWEQGTIWYVWGLAVGTITYIAHVGGISEDNLSVCFSIKGAESTMDGQVYISTIALENRLKELTPNNE